MADQQKRPEKGSSAGEEERAITAARNVKKYIINKEILTKLKKKRGEQHRRARRYVINTELLEANGRPGQGSRIIDLSMNEAKLELPFSPPFMSQITLNFSLRGAEKVFKVVGRVIWSKLTLQKGRYEVGIQFYQNYWEIDYLLRLEVR
jgi:hypothetical protein